MAELAFLFDQKLLITNDIKRGLTVRLQTKSGDSAQNSKWVHVSPASLGAQKAETDHFTLNRDRTPTHLPRF